MHLDNKYKFFFFFLEEAYECPFESMSSRRGQKNAILLAAQLLDHTKHFRLYKNRSNLD
jgi:hypothetical protein